MTKINREQLRDLILKEISTSNQKELDSNTITETAGSFEETGRALGGLKSEIDELRGLINELTDAVHAIEAALGGEGIELKPRGNYEPRAVVYPMSDRARAIGVRE